MGSLWVAEDDSRKKMGLGDRRGEETQVGRWQESGVPRMYVGLEVVKQPPFPSLKTLHFL